MDYKTFLDFVLAMENKKSPQSLAYFWKIIDVYGKGAIDTFVINMFFKEVLGKLKEKNQDVEKDFNVEDIKDEIFDMAKPKVPMAITLEDLIECGQGDVIISILVDAKAFFDYDQREAGNTLNVDDDAEILHQLEQEENTTTSTFGSGGKKVGKFNEV